jgi:23S rRNA (adenine-N6)-dimethyltransferase
MRRRAYGQNFLRSPALVRSLVVTAGVGPTDLVIEPGAGTGVITEALANVAGRVVAIELDPDWFRQLQDKFARVPNVEVRNEDLFAYALPTCSPYRIFGNLPFGQTTNFLRHILDATPQPPIKTDIIVQLEVARKYSAKRTTTLLAASWQPWYEFSLSRVIPAEAFRPVPRVRAGLLSIVKRDDPLVPLAARKSFAAFVSAGFAGPTVWDGLRGRLTANQARQLRRHSSLREDARPTDLASVDWALLFNSSLRFHSG